MNQTPALAIDTASPTPPFEQIRAQITALISAGALRPGDRLPSVRQLAADLELAPGTVARAYRELEGAALVVTRRRTGTHIADTALPAAGAGRAEQLANAARIYAAAVRRLGADDAEAEEAVRAALAE